MAMHDHVLSKSTDVPGAVMKALLQDNIMSTVIFAVSIYTSNKPNFPKSGLVIDEIVLSMQDPDARHSTQPWYASDTGRAVVTLSRKLKTEWLDTPRPVREQTDMLVQLHLFYLHTPRYGQLWQR
jgi:hypothetical protein